MTEKRIAQMEREERRFRERRKFYEADLMAEFIREVKQYEESLWGWKRLMTRLRANSVTRNG